MELRDAFLAQAAGCAALGSPFMERLMRLLARHWPQDTALADWAGRWEGGSVPPGRRCRCGWRAGFMRWC